MKRLVDLYGHEVKVGDKVVIAKDTNCYSDYLVVGIVKEIKQCANSVKAIVDVIADGSYNYNHTPTLHYPKQIEIHTGNKVHSNILIL